MPVSTWNYLFWLISLTFDIEHNLQGVAVRMAKHVFFALLLTFACKISKILHLDLWKRHNIRNNVTAWWVLNKRYIQSWSGHLPQDYSWIYASGRELPGTNYFKYFSFNFHDVFGSEIVWAPRHSFGGSDGPAYGFTVTQLTKGQMFVIGGMKSDGSLSAKIYRGWEERQEQRLTSWLSSRFTLTISNHSRRLAKSWNVADYLTTFLFSNLPASSVRMELIVLECHRLPSHLYASAK